MSKCLAKSRSSFLMRTCFRIGVSLRYIHMRYCNYIATIKAHALPCKAISRLRSPCHFGSKQSDEKCRTAIQQRRCRISILQRQRLVPAASRIFCHIFSAARCLVHHSNATRGRQMMNTMPLRGSCNCGAITITMDLDDAPLKTSLCHCLDCRTSGSSLYVQRCTDYTTALTFRTQGLHSTSWLSLQKCKLPAALHQVYIPP